MGIQIKKNKNQNKKKDLSTWQKIKALGPKTTIAIFLLAAADVFVIAAPFYLKSVVPNIQVYMGVKESDISLFTSVLGWVVLLTQLPGGWLADKFSSRKMLSLSTAATGLITVWFGILIIYSSKLGYDSLKAQYLIIFALWGVSSTPFFWTPLTKLISQQGNKDSQGFVYGMEGSMNGAIGLVFVFGIGTAVTEVIDARTGSEVTGSTELTGQQLVPFAIYIFIFAVALLIVGALAWFFIAERQTNEKFAVSTRSFIRAMMDWKLWALSIFLLGMYMFQSVFAYYLNQMLSNVLNINNVWLLVISGLRLYGIRFVVSAFIGKFSDKFRSLTLILIIALCIGFVLVGIFLFLPGINSEPLINAFNSFSDGYKLFATIFMCILFLLSSVLSWAMVTLRYAQLAEVDVPKNGYGAASALMSFIGFSSDAWFYQVGSAVANQYTDPETNTVSQMGYQIILGIGMGVAAIGLIAGILLYWHNNKMLSKHNINYFRWRTLHNV